MDERSLWRVLIVDDDEDDYFLTRSMLEMSQSRRIELSWAPTYEQGLHQLRSGRFDAALIDYDLGLTSGIDLIREVVQEGYPAPLILFTGRGSYEVDMEAMHAGATLYLTKAEANPLLLERVIRYAIERKQIEETQRRERELLAKVIDNVPVGVAVFEGAELRCVLANPSYQQSSPEKSGEMLGRTLAEIYPRQVQQGSDRYLHQVLLSGKSTYLSEYKYEDLRDENPSWWNLHHLPLSDADGKINRVLTLAQEITGQILSRNQVEAERSLLRAVLDQLPIGVFIAEGPSGKIISINEKAKVMLGSSVPTVDALDEYTRFNAEHLDGSLYHPEELPLVRSLVKGEVITKEEMILPTTAGARIIAWISSAPVYDRQGQIVAAVAVVEDITQLRKMEERLSFQTLALTNIHDAIIISDRQRRITAWNEPARELYGWSAPEAIGRLEYEIFQTGSDPQSHADMLEWLEQHGSLTYETTHHARDGSPLIVEGNVTAIRDADGAISGYITAIYDITARKQVEDLLQQREQKISEILESIGDAFFAIDRSWCFTYVNQKAAQLAGSKRKKMTSKSLWEMPVLLEGAGLEQAYRTAMEKRTPDRLEFYSTRLGGWYEVNIYPARDGISVYWLDISERKQLAEHLAYQALIMENIQDAVIVANCEHYITSWNRGAERLYGFKEQEVLGKVVKDLLHTEISEEQRQKTFALLDQIDSYSLEVHQHTKDGRRILVDARLFALRDSSGEVIGYTSTNRDITNRKKSEQTMRAALEQQQESERHLQLAFEAASMGSWTWTFGEEEVSCSETFFRIHGLESRPHGRLKLQEYLTTIHPEDQQRLMGHIQNSFEGKVYEKVEDHEFRVLLPDGTIRWMAAYQRPIIHDGVLKGITGVTVDIDDLKRSQEAAQRSEKQIRRILNNLFAYVGLLDTDGIVLDVNQAPLEMAEISHEDVLGKRFDQAYWWSHSAEVQAKIHDAIQRGARGETVRFDVTVHAAKDQIITIDFMLAPLRDEQGAITGLIPSGVDISDRKRAERALSEYALQLERSNQDLEEFASVASHDLQEPLRKVSSFSTALLKSAVKKLDATELDYLRRMDSASRRMSHMLSSLLSYSRITSEKEEICQVDLNSVVQEVLSDLELSLQHSGGQVQVDLLPQVEGAPIQMRRLVQNLLSNALKFHNPGEPPRVQVRKVKVDSGMVQIDFIDNGICLDEEQLELIFEPFKRLVRKSTYEGSGLGLAICRKIVERHGGKLTATSVQGQGSTFHLVLPQRQPAEISAPPAASR
jgi:PAS domain S-box-containing protein